ncbi:MAG TPA: ABC transporter substrate-binding protein [Alphaproteobacteria bacterium]
MERILRLAFALAAVAAVGHPAFAADKLNLAISQKGFWDSVAAYFAIERGYTKEEGLDVSYSWTSGGSETVQAVATRSVDMAIGTGFVGVIAAYSKGVPVRIIATHAAGAPEIFWYVRADSPVKSMADLAGKTLAYSRPGSTTHTVAIIVARKLNPPPKLISTGGVPATRTQVMSGQIDAGWSTPPFVLDLVRKGEARIAFRGAEVQEVQDQTIRVEIANAAFVTEKRDVAARFIKAYWRALNWMYDKPDESAEAYAKFAGIDLADAKMTREFSPRAMYDVDRLRGVDQVMQQAIEGKFIEKPLTEAQLNELVQFVYRPSK